MDHHSPESLIKTVAAHSSASINATTANGASLDLKGANNLRLAMFFGATGGGVTLSAALEDSEDNSTFAAALDDAGNAITFTKAASTALDFRMARIRASRLARYVRLVITTAGGAVTASVAAEAWGLKDSAYADGAAGYAKLV